MTDPAKLPNEELERAQYLGMATYSSAYIRRMMRELGVSEDTLGVNDMVGKMVEPLNDATEAIWCALMEDHRGMRDALDRFQGKLSKI